MNRKYYDDCAQILAEHILAAVKPAFHAGFSTLDPLLTVKNEYDFGEQFNSSHSSTFNAQRLHRRTGSTLSRATRILQGEPNDDDEDDYENYTNIRHDSPTSSLAATAASSPSEKASSAPESHLVSGATTLEEGAIPIREYPNHLTSEPASMCPSSASSQVDENETERRTRQMSFSGSHAEELRCVIAVVRHGDRTPKQKLKVTLTEPLILKYFDDHADDCRKDLKVKAKKPMTEFLETVKTIIANMDAIEANLDRTTETTSPNVPFAGVDRSLQYKLLHMRDVLERWKIAGLNRKLQIKPNQWEEVVDEVTGQTKMRCTQVLLILKWGGNLTKLGEKQSVSLGQRLRNEMYPYSPGGGILRLHSTFRHDLKIKTSDEGRVMKTAAAFAKGFLELEGDLPPILISLVHKVRNATIAW
jgi:inositol hexakisphosphate/diphosphoinositol-pentakisphosphate kinase